MSRRLTTEEFVERLLKRQPDRSIHDFSNFEYQGTQIKGEVTCNKGHTFNIRPNDLITGHFCKECAKKRIKGRPPNVVSSAVKSEALKAGLDVDWSSYETTSSRLKSTCNKCGETSDQRAGYLVDNLRCPKCSMQAGFKKLVLTTQEFILRAQKVHGDKAFDYSFVDYKGIEIKVRLVCNRCGNVSNHTPTYHLAGHKCHCSSEHKGSLSILTEVEFISKADSFYGEGKYLYDKVGYVNYKTKVLIGCKEEGHNYFLKMPSEFFRGQGCPTCSAETSRIKQMKPQGQYIKECSTKHSNRYDYSLTTYNGRNYPITVICPIHKAFEIGAGAHIDGSGCKLCVYQANDYSERFKLKTPAKLYYIKIKTADKTYYKIGVTTKTVAQRFQGVMKSGSTFEILDIKNFELGMDAYKEERRLLIFHGGYVTKDSPLKNGNTEVFDRDILNLDT